MNFLPCSSIGMLLLPFTTLAVWSLSLVDDQVGSIQPSVVLDHATVIGRANETTGTVQYLGIPFAQPPYVIFHGVALRSLLLT